MSQLLTPTEFTNDVQHGAKRRTFVRRMDYNLRLFMMVGTRQRFSLVQALSLGSVCRLTRDQRGGGTGWTEKRQNERKHHGVRSSPMIKDDDYVPISPLKKEPSPIRTVSKSITLCVRRSQRAHRRRVTVVEVSRERAS